MELSRLTPRRLRLVRGAAAAMPGPPTAVVHAVGCLADLVAATPVIRALARRDAFRQVVVNVGPADGGPGGDPGAGAGTWALDHRVHVRAGTPAEETACALVGFERVLVREKPDVVVINGGESRTLACALAAAKLGVSVARVGAGLRWWDWTVAEEVDRALTDRLAETLFTDSSEAARNLTREGVPSGRVHAVGSTLVDGLRAMEPRARARRAWASQAAPEGEYVLVVLELEANVRRPDRLQAIIAALSEAARHGPILLALPPGSPAPLGGAGERSALRVLRRPPFLDLLSLELGAGLIVTDTGRVQEEAAALGVACRTLDSATNRRVTLTHGANVLLGDDPRELAGVRVAEAPPAPCAIPLWDGDAGERVAEVLVRNYVLRAGSAGAR